MASQQTKQLKKRKRREQDNKHRKLAEDQRRQAHERQRLYRVRYPEFRFDTTNADPRFVEHVRAAVATINFDDTSAFPGWQAELYQMLKADGNRTLRNELVLLKLDAAEAGEALGKFIEIEFFFTLGQTVLDRIPESVRDSYLPLNDFMVVPRGRHIRVVVRSLATAKGPGGTIYFSRHKPTLEIDGIPKIVAFSKHAIDQLCERIKPRWKTSYAALGDVFAFLDQCVYFERRDLFGNQLAFTFYDGCDPRFVQHRYIEDVVGEGSLESTGGKPYYRVGYCPAVIEGEFIKAKTLLFPGYNSTPEYGLLVRSSLPRLEKQSLLQQVRDLNAHKLYESNDMSLIKWFHDHGVPQVVQLDREIFTRVG
jgi:hypothetical protein